MTVCVNRRSYFITFLGLISIIFFTKTKNSLKNCKQILTRLEYERIWCLSIFDHVWPNTYCTIWFGPTSGITSTATRSLFIKQFGLELDHEESNARSGPKLRKTIVLNWHRSYIALCTIWLRLKGNWGKRFVKKPSEI